MCVMFFFFKQKTAYEMRISDWSSDVCSSDLFAGMTLGLFQNPAKALSIAETAHSEAMTRFGIERHSRSITGIYRQLLTRSEEHTSELQSLMRISYAVFCLKKKKQKQQYKLIQ